MKKKAFLSLLPLIFLLTACGPDDENIARAQSAYRELVSVHNSVVEAYKEISDGSLDNELNAMESAVNSYKELNLYSMEDAEIDNLAASMIDLKEKYGEYITKIADIKADEESHVIKQLPFNLTNGTYMTFTSLSLKAKGDNGSVTDVLSDMSSFEPEDEIIGLSIYKNVSNTHWIMTLVSGDTEYEIEIDPSALSESGNSFTVTFEEETEENISLKLV